MSGLEAIFGVVTGGAGLVSLGMQLTDSARKLRRFYQTAKNAPKALNELSETMDTMVTLLHLINQYQGLQAQTPTQNLTQVVISRCVAECERCSDDVTKVLDKMQSHMDKRERLRGRLYFAFEEQDIKELSDRLEKAKGSLTLAYTVQSSISTRCLLYQSEELNKKQNQVLVLGEQIVAQLQAPASPDDQDAMAADSAARTEKKGRPPYTSYQVIRYELYACRLTI